MKTPEEMAEEYCNTKQLSHVEKLVITKGFIDGYKAAENHFRDDTEKVGPQWISVKDRLPAPQEEVLWWNKAAHQAGVSSYEYMPYCNDTMIEWGDAGNVSIKNFTHWQPLPTPPKEDK